MKEYLQHIASDGERWDGIAYRYYGDATCYEQIIADNNHLPIRATLSAGDIVLIAITDKLPKHSQHSDVPFWLRAGASQ